MAEKQLTADMKWSFSKISTYTECPLAFWFRYMQSPPLPDEPSAWSDYGILCHALLEEYALGKLSIFDLADEYARRYPSIVVHNYPPFPKGYEEKAYQQGVDYFSTFNGFGDEYEILSAEEKFEMDVGGYAFVGISDLVLRHRETSSIVVVDHKTKSPKSMKHDFPLYINQLYLYAEHVKNKYGRYPDELRFNMIKDPSASIIEPFNIDQMQSTLKWTQSQIDRIYMEEDWLAKGAQEISAGGSDYYCRWICPVFQYCTEAQQAIANRQKR